ncbi:MAG: hypothetical protein ABI406_19895 [Ktedonobacteraceae bacterium]
MEATEILERTQTEEELPHGWIVFPLARSKVILGMVGWVFGIILGLGLFTLMASIVIPYNYTLGTFSAIFTSLLLLLFLFIGLGSFWSLIRDGQRLMQLDKHVIVLTPEDFVKQEGDKIIHVPLAYVRHVTARGKAPVDRSVPKEHGVRQVPGLGDNVSGFLFGRGITPSGMRYRRNRMRTPTTLAFIDDRDEREVVVVTDAAHGDPFMIAALLKQYSRGVQDAVH